VKTISRIAALPHSVLALTSVLLLGLPLVSLILLLALPALDVLVMERTFHFWVVSGTSVAAAVAFAVVMLFTPSLSETRLVFLGLAFLAIAGIFSVHGLATPGHIHDQLHAELRISSWLSVTAGSLFIALSVLALPPAAESLLRRWGPALVCSVAVGVGVYIGLSLASPDWLAFLPYEDRRVQLVLSAANMGLLAFSAWRYFQAYLFARLVSQWAMVCAMVLLMQVQVSLTFGTVWHLSWWHYHATYALAFGVIFFGWAHESRRAGSVRVLAEALSMRDAIAQLNHGHAQPVADLVDAIEWKDAYTLGHVRRVATFAVMMGKELGLSTLELRSLALGAQMHDVGKIGVPDRILTKPGRLTEEEFAVIKEHVGRGYEIARGVLALSNVTDAIRFHHERYDGSGYPSGLAGEAIPLHARVVAIADAFDAMTSGRAYQAAVSMETAREELLRCAGSHFDPVCVEAFIRAFEKLDVQVGELRAAS